MATRIKRCKDCGRNRAEAETHELHRGEQHFTYHRCVCGREWTTVTTIGFAVQDPVTAGEVLEVHERMKREDLSLGELLS